MAARSVLTNEPMSSTPYLDRQLLLPAPNRQHSKVRLWQAALLLGTLLIGTIRIVYFLWLLVILIHELGHLAAGLLVGDEFDCLRVGPLRFDRTRKVNWEGHWGSLFSGETRTFPTLTSSTGLRWRLSLATLGGPAANLLSGYFALRFKPSDDSLLTACFYVFIAQSFLAGIANLLPVVRHGWMSDGMRICALIFSRRKSERLIFILRQASAAKRGERVKAPDTHDLASWASVKDQTAAQVFASWAAYREEKDSKIAACYLDSCLACCSATTPEFRDELIVEAAKFQILRRKRVDLAREWLLEDRSGKQRLNRYLAEGLILAQTGEKTQAIAKIDEALTFIATTPDTPLRLNQENAFKKWRLELEEKPADGNTVQQPKGV